jgi:hypothetical protein
MNFRSDYSEVDLESAIEHGVGNMDADTVSFLNYTESLDHIVLIESLGVQSTKLNCYPAGWANGRAADEILTALININETTKDYWNGLLEGFYSKQLPPVIVINKKLCDGAHRSILYYLFNAPIKIANFVADDLES